MKRNTIILCIATLIGITAVVESCVSTKVIGKSGTTLWSENCQRCHNTPPSSAFTNTQWEVINTHMRQRAILTEDEYKKITEFMQAGE
ncbi:cytochrome c [Sediminibacterium sp.]|uniref:cytochrome c n=1 Tax=Sediminibacterium sp. TaxID=1917865 RepID=UPI002731EDD2|nr:cytochrome c [Sediminibacterium sp.]MDP2421355.1 cytochrome c [Sediminibacterium sp.]